MPPFLYYFPLTTSCVSSIPYLRQILDFHVFQESIDETNRDSDSSGNVKKKAAAEDEEKEQEPEIEQENERDVEQENEGEKKQKEAGQINAGYSTSDDDDDDEDDENSGYPNSEITEREDDNEKDGEGRRALRYKIDKLFTTILDNNIYPRYVLTFLLPTFLKQWSKCFSSSRKQEVTLCRRHTCFHAVMYLIPSK